MLLHLLIYTQFSESFTCYFYAFPQSVYTYIQTWLIASNSKLFKQPIVCFIEALNAEYLVGMHSRLINVPVTSLPARIYVS